ncbi:MAG: hypothetical protein FJ255_03835 [Phycisphaerae bacterium]|nr:hypothetical protein [Phycisphaerae bacterium]
MNLSTQQWVNLLVVAMIVGFSAIGWVVRKLQEQAAKKRAIEEVERRRSELLRTGKDPALGGPAGPPMTEQEARLREIAARRQAQLQELRRRAQARQQQEGPGPVVVRAPTAGTPGRVPIPATVAQPVPRVVRRPSAARPARAAQPTARPPQPRPAHQASADAKPKHVPPAHDVSEHPEGESFAHRLVPDVPIEAPVRAPVKTRFVPRSAADWRKALVLREIIKPPPGLTGTHAGPDHA